MLIRQKPRRVKELEMSDGTKPFARWFSKLKDVRAKAQIRLRFNKIETDGHLGDYSPVGDGVFELRFFTGPGYRVYFAHEGERIILLLMGGDKSTQAKDIARAKVFREDWKRRKKHA